MATGRGWDPSWITVSLGNAKLGPIANFSLPSIETCPGRTSLCERICYGGKIDDRFPSSLAAYERNLDNVLSVDWDLQMLRWLARNQPRSFRIHVDGDFFSVAYIQDWVAIAQANPGTVFLAYTRSWRIAPLRRALEHLRSLDNVRLFASADSEAHDTPAGWPVAWIDAPVDGSKAIKCPTYSPAHIQCADCNLCFRPSPRNLYFPSHL